MRETILSMNLILFLRKGALRQHKAILDVASNYNLRAGQILTFDRIELSQTFNV